MVDNVFGESKIVYRFDGRNAPSSEQGGLSLNTTSLLSTPEYSIDLIFSFDFSGPSWQRILDISNRSSDNGFYVQPDGRLQIYPVGSGTDIWIFVEYQRVTLTNSGTGRVTGYMNGLLQFNLSTSVMDFNSYSGNQDKILTFFADNTIGSAQTEWVPGKVSLIRLYNRELTATEIFDIGANLENLPVNADCGE